MRNRKQTLSNEAVAKSLWPFPWKSEGEKRFMVQLSDWAPYSAGTHPGADGIRQ